MSDDVLLPLPADYTTLFLLFISLIIFSWLAIGSRNIRSFQFQISIFIAIYVMGAIVEIASSQGLVILPPPYQEDGFLIHVGSMIFFSVMIWLRYYLSQKSGKKMIEEIDE